MVSINSLSQFNSGATIISCRCFGRQKVISMAAHYRATTASCRRCSAAYLLPMAALARAAYQPVGTGAAVRIWPETPFGARDRRARRDPTLRDCSAAFDMAPFIRTGPDAQNQLRRARNRWPCLADAPCHDQTFAEPGVEFRCQAAAGAVPRPAPTKHAPTPDRRYRDRESGGAAGRHDHLIRTMGRTVASPMTALDRSRSNGYCDCRRHQNVQGTQPTSLTPLESFDVDRNCEVV